MTREEARERIQIMQAYVDGKDIQFRFNNKSEWHDTDNPKFYEENEYRIKPKPKITPFDNMAEFCKAWDGKPLLDAEPSSVGSEGEFRVEEIYINGVTLSPSGFWSWDNLATAFKFSDDTPCGKVLGE